jgi:hypothetical protein
LDYDRIYPCKEYDDGKTKTKKPSDSTQTDQADEGDSAGRCTAGEEL